MEALPINQLAKPEQAGLGRPRYCVKISGKRRSSMKPSALGIAQMNCELYLSQFNTRASFVFGRAGGCLRMLSFVRESIVVEREAVAEVEIHLGEGACWLW
jgi:hypothetical protein